MPGSWVERKSNMVTYICSPSTVGGGRTGRSWRALATPESEKTDTLPLLRTFTVARTHTQINIKN